MYLVRRSPNRDMFGWPHRVNRLFSDFFPPIRHEEESMSPWDWNPVVDVYEDNTNIVIKAELSGVDKQNIAIDVKDRILTLKGERASDTETKEENYYRKERTFGKFERRFALPGDVDTETITANHKDGLLRIEIPKPEKSEPRNITVH